MNKYTDEQLNELAELYSLDVLEGEDKAAFESLLYKDVHAQKILSEHKAFIRLVNHKTKKEIVRQQLNLIRKENKTSIQRINEGLSVHINKYWKTASVAAGIAACASLLTFGILKNRYDNLLISNERNLAKITNEVSKIKKDIQKKDKKATVYAQPIGTSKQSGTCFAIDNNGFAITNAHVVKDNLELYIYTNDDVAHKVKVVAIDKDLDIAVLKIDEEGFKFGTQSLPYSIDTRTAGLAQRVYTLGFPKSSIVYSEGYVSSEFGRNDDSSRYQMMLPSDPGVSGSPVFNEQGNIVAVINSRESLGSSTTYALKAKKLNNLLSSVEGLNLNATTKSTSATRQEQIKRRKDFVFVVKIY
jgi:serine protease Do